MNPGPAGLPGPQHAPMAPQELTRILLGNAQQIHRVGCYCGWRGSWWSALDLATAAHKRHMEMA